MLLSWTQVDKENNAVRKAYAAGLKYKSDEWHCPCCKTDIPLTQLHAIEQHTRKNACGVLTDSME